MEGEERQEEKYTQKTSWSGTQPGLVQSPVETVESTHNTEEAVRRRFDQAGFSKLYNSSYFYYIMKYSCSSVLLPEKCESSFEVLPLKLFAGNVMANTGVYHF